MTPRHGYCCIGWASATGGACELGIEKIRLFDALLPFQRNGHYDLFQGSISCSLPNAIDGALNLPGSVHSSTQAVGSGKPKVVLAMRGDDNTVGSWSVCFNGGDKPAKLVRKIPSGRVGNIQCCGTSLWIAKK